MGIGSRIYERVKWLGRLSLLAVLLKMLKNYVLLILTFKFSRLIKILKQDPYQPPYEKLSGNLQGYYSRRINIKHRLVYSIDESSKVI